LTFNSLVFAIFLPAVLLPYYVLGRRAQNVLLLVASYVFYGWWDWRFLGLLALTTVVDYVCGLKIEGATTRRARRGFLWLSIGTNLSVLLFFKYFNFFAQSASALLTSVGLHASAPLLRIILPIGISFYTFQSMSYAIDIYRGHMKARRDFLTFAAFVAYFPQLVAGPIERAANLLPRLEADRRVDWSHIQEGFLLILIGLFKKVAVADTLAPLVDARFQHPALASGADLLLALYLFSVQIYCDFSGYSDIARGTSKLFGIELMVNFRRPYFASSITEFWRRWHISLSSWLRDYVFLPLSYPLSRRLDGIRWLGFRDDIWVYSIATLVTMFLSGLWHGARWTFVVWGGLHGLFMALHRFAVPRRSRRRSGALHRSIRTAVGVVVTFHLVAIAWVFFRTDSFSAAALFLNGILHWHPALVGGLEPMRWTSLRLLAVIGPLVALDVFQEAADNELVLLRRDWRLQGAAYAVLVLVLLVFGNLRGDVPFIYFQF
jgi:alginate O-acetyltransferase complex protein AlgI